MIRECSKVLGSSPFPKTHCDRSSGRLCRPPSLGMGVIQHLADTPLNLPRHIRILPPNRGQRVSNIARFYPVHRQPAELWEGVSSQRGKEGIGLPVCPACLQFFVVSFRSLLERRHLLTL